LLTCSEAKNAAEAIDAGTNVLPPGQN